MYRYNTAGQSAAYLLASLLPLLLVLLIPHMICGCLCGKLSRKKGYSGHFWTGFFLGILGLLYVIGLPDMGLRECIKASCEKARATDRKPEYSGGYDPNRYADPSENARY